jgi:hypothetical protein
MWAGPAVEAGSALKHRLLPPPVLWAAALDLAVGAVSALCVALIVDGPSGLSVVVGFVLVVLFFGVSAWSVLVVEQANRNLMLPTALVVYGTGLLVLWLVADQIGDDGALRTTPIAVSAGAAIIVWLAVHIVAAVRSDGRATQPMTGDPTGEAE